MSDPRERIKVAVDNTREAQARDLPALNPWERFVTPEFPLDILPPSLQAYVRLQSRSMGGDLSGVAMSCLTALSSAISHDFRLKMARTGDFHVRPRLWTLLVGDPSTRKTPIQRSAIDPLDELDQAAVNEHERRLAFWRAEPKDTRGDEPARPARFVVRDSTPEKMAELLGRSQRGVLHFRDEIAGFVGSLEKYGTARAGAADRAFWLKAYDGGRYTLDRVNAGERSVTNLSISFLGGIQPDRLVELGNLTSDGLLQRFLPVMLRRPTLPHEVDDDGSCDEYSRLIAFFASLPAVRILCGPDAQRVTARVQAQLFELEQSDALSKGLTAFVGKLPGVYGSLALILHLIVDPEHGRETQVDGATAEAAEQLVMQFLLPHATEFYRTADDKTDGEQLRAIASYLLTSVPSRFRAADFTANVRSLRQLSVWDLNRKLSPLVAGGWLDPTEDSPTCRSWELTAGLRERFAVEAEAERQRRDRVRGQLAALRGGGLAAE